MKKRVGLLLIAITICFFSLGCNKTATIDNHIFETDLKSDSGYTWKSLRMDNEYIDNIECLVDDNIVYSKYENGVTNLVFYNYNITDKQTYRLGSIKDPYINSGDVVVVGNEVFFYCNRVVGTDDSTNQISSTKDTLQTVTVQLHTQKRYLLVLSLF